MAAVRIDKDKGVNVQVLLRCRPFNDDEIHQQLGHVISCNEHRKEVTVHQNNTAIGLRCERTFTFDKVFGPESQQGDLYKQALIPVVDEVLEGFNCTIFAYGQTGTGKTYTMEGRGNRTQDGLLHAHAGVIPRAVEQIFDTLESQQIEYSVKVTFLELYNEELTDLLAPDDKQKKPLALMEDGKAGATVVRGLEEEIVRTASDIFSLLERGSSKRKTAETILNKQSSRSHTIFSITIHMREPTPDGQELIKCGKLNLVDLAGSENISRSGARDGRAREAGEINKSLLTLGRVITTLVDHSGHIPYRDSKLTRLLRDSLGGRTKTCIIATISPSPVCIEETLNTLDYAYRAKSIKNKPEVNQKTTKSALIKELASELERVKTELYFQREKTGVYIPLEKYQQDLHQKNVMKERITYLEEALEIERKALGESEDKHAVLLSEHEKLQQLLELNQERLKETESRLATSEGALQTARQALRERDYVIARTREAENNLADLGWKTREELQSAANDLEAFFFKLEKDEQVKAANEEAGSRMKSSIEHQLDQLQNFVAQSIGFQQDHCAAMNSQLQAVLLRKDDDNTKFGHRLHELRGIFTKEVDEASSAIDEQMGRLAASWEGLALGEERFLLDLRESLTGTVKHAQAALGDLEKLHDTERLEAATFADNQREASLKAVEISNAITLTMQTLLERIAVEMDSCASTIRENSSMQAKELAVLTKLLEEEDEREMQGYMQIATEASAKRKALVAQQSTIFIEAAEINAKSMQSNVYTTQATVTSGKAQMAEFNSTNLECAKSVQAATAAKHTKLKDFLNKSVAGAQRLQHTWQDAAGVLVNSINVHDEEFRKTHGEQAAASAEFRKSNSSRKRAIVAHYDEGQASLTSLVSDSQKADVMAIEEARKGVNENCANVKTFWIDHGGHTKQLSARIDTYLHELQVDNGSPPKRRTLLVPRETSFEELRTKPAEKLLEEFRSSLANIENLQASVRKPKPLAQTPITPFTVRN